MFRIMKKLGAKNQNAKSTLCTGCGFDLAGQHWNHCPRCHTPHHNETGCGGCGNCKN